MYLEYKICPRCGDKFLKLTTKLVPGDVHYEWRCVWCNTSFGNYNTQEEANRDYEEKCKNEL